MKKVSLVMMVKNEESHIRRCLESARSSVDELIVVDTGSTDKTKEIAQKCGAIVFDFPWIYDFSAARNFGLTKASGEWILILDADEYLTKDCRETIQNHINSGERIGRIPIKSKFRFNGEVQESISYISRLFPNGISFAGRIHEQLESDLPRVIVPIEVLHEGYYLTDKTERNISLLERELKAHPGDSYYLYQLAREYRSRKDYAKANELFLKSYQSVHINEPYAPNVIIDYLNNLIHSQHYTEALHLAENHETLLGDYPDFHFAKGTLLTNYLLTLSNTTIEDLQNIESAYLKCLAIGDSHKSGSVIGTGSFLAAFNLGVYYQLLGLREKAIYYYEMAEQQGYEPATLRLQSL